MRISNLDTELLLVLMRENGGTTTTLAKSLFDVSDVYELRRQDNKIRYRLERMRDKDLVTKRGTQYRINPGRVFLTPAKLELAIGVKVPMGLMLVVYPKDDELLMRQVSISKNNR